MSSNFKNLYTSNNPPLEATLIRGSNIESIHKIHAVITDKKGRVLMCAGNPEYKSFIRSALKPFQAIPFVSSGAASNINNDSKSIALACGSHSGSKLHSREAFKILWEYDIDISSLKCPKTKTSPLEHNCSGKHAAFLATCKKMNWPLDSYLKGDHPLQIEIFRIISVSNLLLSLNIIGLVVMALLICSNSALSELLKSEYNLDISISFKKRVGAPQSSRSAFISDSGISSNSETILNISICSG